MKTTQFMVFFNTLPLRQYPYVTQVHVYHLYIIYTCIPIYHIHMYMYTQGCIQKFMLGGANYEQVGVFVAAI